MEGGLSRKRGYAAIVALLAAALALLLLWRGCRRENVPPATLDTTRLAQLDNAVRQRQDTPPALPRARRQPRHDPAATPGNLTPSAARHDHPRSSRATATLELNSADTADLQRLWGIGPVYAARIVRYRNLLGGFVDIQQLREVYGLADSVFRRIAPQLSVDTSRIRRLDLNTASYGQLLRHPYLDKHQVAAILRLREKQGPFLSTDDLHRIPIIEQETFNKIIPYLTCNSQPLK